MERLGVLTVIVEFSRPKEKCFVPKVILNHVYEGPDAWEDPLIFSDGEDGYEDLLKLWVARANRKANNY